MSIERHDQRDYVIAIIDYDDQDALIRIMSAVNRCYSHHDHHDAVVPYVGDGGDDAAAGGGDGGVVQHDAADDEKDDDGDGDAFLVVAVIDRVPILFTRWELFRKKHREHHHHHHHGIGYNLNNGNPSNPIYHVYSFN